MRHATAKALVGRLSKSVRLLMDVDIGRLPVKGLDSPSYLLRRLQTRALAQAMSCPAFADIPGWKGDRPSSGLGMFASEPPEWEWLS